MKPKCKFCQKEITTTHYGITKNGTVCLNCIRRTKDALGSITDVCNSRNFNSDRRGKEVENEVYTGADRRD